MNETIYVVVLVTEEAEDFQQIDVLQRRAFKDEANAELWREQLTRDFGGTFNVVPLVLE